VKYVLIDRRPHAENVLPPGDAALDWYIIGHVETGANQSLINCSVSVDLLEVMIT